MLLDRAAAALWPQLELACPLRSTTIFNGGLRTKPYGKFAPSLGQDSFSAPCYSMPQVRTQHCDATAGPLATRAVVRTAASMAQDERDNTIWVKEGPGKISGAAEGPLTNLTFAAKDLYDVRCSMHVCNLPSACRVYLDHTSQNVLHSILKCKL